MPRHEEKRDLPYTAVQMFDLVADIESYPLFFAVVCGGADYWARGHGGADGGACRFADFVQGVSRDFCKYRLRWIRTRCVLMSAIARGRSNIW